VNRESVSPNESPATWPSGCMRDRRTGYQLQDFETQYLGLPVVRREAVSHAMTGQKTWSGQGTVEGYTTYRRLYGPHWPGPPRPESLESVLQITSLVYVHHVQGVPRTFLPSARLQIARIHTFE
jgi:hypothetical protein